MPRVLIITEDLRTASSLTAELAGANYTVAAATFEPEDFHEALGKGAPDAIIMDARSPVFDLTSARRKIQQNEDLKGTAVVALISENNISSLTPANVEDFIIYPPRPGELLIRLKILLARLQKLESGNIVKLDGLVVDLDNYMVEVDGEALELTFKEFELLRFLITHRGRVFTREALLNRVWGYDYFGGARTVDVHVRRLRSKLGEYESNIETVRNVGYRFTGNANSSAAKHP